MAYILESETETRRLETQNQMEEYRIEDELKVMDLPGHTLKVLDAGCGSGTLSRALFGLGHQYEVDACDFSELRIQQAKQLSEKYKIHFFQSDLSGISQPDNSYDMIFIRFVLEHVKNPQIILKELYRILKPNGSLIAIDLDGLMYNLYPRSPFVNECLIKLEEKLPIDLHIGRKLPFLLEEASFKINKVVVRPMVFRGENFNDESEQMLMRLGQSRPLIKTVLENETDQFIYSYMKDFDQSRFSTFNKFLVKATK